MSDDLVKRAREAMQGVTEGPWQPGEALLGAVFNWHLPTDHPNAIICQEATEADADFIAAARQLVPEMARRIEAQDKLIAELTNALIPFAAAFDLSLHTLCKTRTLGCVEAMAAHQTLGGSFQRASRILARLEGGKTDE